MANLVVTKQNYKQVLPYRCWKTFRFYLRIYKLFPYAEFRFSKEKDLHVVWLRDYAEVF